MSARALILAAVGTGCILAAGVGGFVAMRLSAPARGAEPQPLYRPAASSAAATGDSASAASPAVASETSPAATPAVDVVPKAKPSEQARSDSTVHHQVTSATQTGPRPSAPPVPTVPVSTATPPLGTPMPIETVAPPQPAPSSAAPGTTATRPQDAPKPRFDELTVVENSVIGISLDQTLSSETAKVEDKVTARVTRDLMVAGRTAIPAGSKLEGNVTLVEHGGKFKERARLGIRFTTLVLPDNTRQQIQTEALFRDGEAPASEATAKVGASAAVGAILGAVIGGKKGAIIGTTAGGAAGAAAVEAGKVNAAVFASGAPLTVRLTSPVTVLIERLQQTDR